MKSGWPAEVDERPSLITPLSDLAEWEGTNRKLDEKFQLLITARLVRFRATDSDLVAFRVFRILKHCKNQGTRRKRKKIFHADSLKLERKLITVVWLSSSDCCEVIRGKILLKFAALCKHFRKNIAPETSPAKRVFGFFEKRTPTY